MSLPNDIPQRLRKAGLKVVETEGWRTRGRPASTGGFAPTGVLCHHTATGRSSSDANVASLLIHGRSDLPGPLAHFGLARDGTVHVIAAGRANHAGTARASGTMSAGDGNRLYIGIEAFNDGSEGWSRPQRDAYVTLCAALCGVTGNSAQTVRAHRETSVTGKWDPGKLDMDALRADIAQKLNKKEKKPVPQLNNVQKGRAALAESLAKANEAAEWFDKADPDRVVVKQIAGEIERLFDKIEGRVERMPRS